MPLRCDWSNNYNGGILDPFVRLIDPTIPSAIPTFPPNPEVEVARVIGTLIREPTELVRYVIPVPVLGLGLTPGIEEVGISGCCDIVGDRDDWERGDDWEVVVVETMDGTGTAGRSVPDRAAWRGSWRGRTPVGLDSRAAIVADIGDEVFEVAEDAEKVRARGGP